MSGFDKKGRDEIQIRTQGMHRDSRKEWMFAEPGVAQCGSIRDGIILRQRGDAGWVISFASLERLYLAAKKARSKVKP